MKYLEYKYSKYYSVRPEQKQVYYPRINPYDWKYRYLKYINRSNYVQLKLDLFF